MIILKGFNSIVKFMIFESLIQVMFQMVLVPMVLILDVMILEAFVPFKTLKMIKPIFNMSTI